MGSLRRVIAALMSAALVIPLWLGTGIVPAQAVVIDPVLLRQTLGVHGDFVQTGNGVLKCDPNAAPGSATACSQMHSGISGTNDDYRMIYTNDAGFTRNSSSGTITIPAGSTVRYARLYWAASNGTWVDKGIGYTGCGVDTAGFVTPTTSLGTSSQATLRVGGVTTRVTGENLVNQTPTSISPSGQKDSHGLYYSDSAEVRWCGSGSI